MNLVATDAGPRALMVLLTPDGTALNLLPAYRIDEAEANAALNWRTCANSLCRAAAVLTPEQEAELKAGAQMVVAYQQFGASAPVRIAVSLSGVTGGLQALSGQ